MVSSFAEKQDCLSGGVVVSVIVPAYGTARYIGETLDSVFAQTFKAFEVIVINDGSPDTKELEKILSSYVSRIIYLKQENRGPAAARNLGIRHAQGEYIAFLDSDDTWYPEFLESQMILLEGPDRPDLIYADSLDVGEGGNAPHRFMENNPSSGVPTFESLLIEKCVIPTSCTVARKKVLLEAGLFDESPTHRGVEDYDLWLRVANHGGRISYQESVLAKRRVRADSLSNGQVAMAEGHLSVLEKLDKMLELQIETRSLLRRHMALVQARCELAKGKSCLANGRAEEARMHLMAANTYFRSRKLRLAVFMLSVAPVLAPLVVKIWNSVLETRNTAKKRIRRFLAPRFGASNAHRS